MRRLHFDRGGGVSGSGGDSCDQDLTAPFGAHEIVYRIRFEKMKQKITYDQSISRVPCRLQTTKPGSYCLLFPQGRVQCQVEHNIAYGGLKSNVSTSDGNNDQFTLLIQVSTY